MALTVFIAYDVSSNQARARIAAQLLRVGTRVQRSVFECVVTPETLEVLVSTLRKVIDLRTDTLHVFPACRPCHEQVLRIGQAPPTLSVRYWVV